MAVDRAAQDWRTTYAEPVLAGAAPAPEKGKALFDQVRVELDVLVADLQTRRTAAAVRADAATAFLFGVGVTIAGVLAAFLIATGVGLRRAVLGPVSALAGQVREVVSGSVQQPVRASGPVEIVELGEDVEAMRRHILDDLVDAQTVNQRLDAQAQELERSNRDLEQFAYVASHDLQEPLRKVSSFCQLLQRRYGGQLDERADQYIEFAVDGSQRMQRLINDLLTFSRVGRTTEGFAPVDLGAVAATAAAQVDTVRAELDGTIEIGELPVVPGDRTLLHQLLVNLLGNGLKFHREGVPPGRAGARGTLGRHVERRGVRQRHRHRARVRRQGLRDLPAAARPRPVPRHRHRPGAREEDRRVPRRADRPRSRRRSRRHHPLHPARGPRGELPMTDMQPRIVNVLLVEDDPGDVLMTREAFDEHLHNRLDVVTDGAAALSYLRREGSYADSPRPDLILLDLNLPRRDGREVLQEVKDDSDLRHIPVIVLTTSQAEEDVLRSYQLHANAYVTKPVDFESFVEAIKQIDHFFVSVVQLPSGRTSLP